MKEIRADANDFALTNVSSDMTLDCVDKKEIKAKGWDSQIIAGPARASSLHPIIEKSDWLQVHED